MRVLILDDSEIRHRRFKEKFSLETDILTHTYTVEECIEAMTNNEYDMVCLDHDLGGQEMVPSGPGTGYEVCEWMVQNQDRVPNIVILHSFNPPGRDNMSRLLGNFGIRSTQHPGYWNV